MEGSGAGPDHWRTNKSKIPVKTKVKPSERKDIIDIGRDPTSIRTQTSIKSNKLSKTLGAKENVPLNKSSKGLSSTDPSLVLPRLKKPAAKSLGYMEMKRVNQELTSEVQSLRENSESKDRLHMEAINQLAEEIAEQKRVHAELKGEIERYQECLVNKNSQLDALHQNLEAIKFENEQLAAVLEGARLDAATGLRIQEGIESTRNQHKWELEWESQHKELDAFIDSLDTTISQLKAQESHIGMDLSQQL